MLLSFMLIVRECDRLRVARIFKRRSPTADPVEPNWICLRVGTDAACDAGPNARGRCHAADGCAPTRTMRAKQQVLANWVAVFVIGIVLMTITYAANTKLLLPGEISTAHSSIGDCAGCHANVDKGQFGWLHSLAQYANPEKDAKACLTCHRMGATATAPHGVAPDELRKIAERQQSTRNGTATSVTAQIGNIVFADAGSADSKVYCATCHKEHRDGGAKLTNMPDSRCHTCHTEKFENFEKDHPEFSDYPFNRRTRVKFDHAAHFAEHFVETRKKKPNLKAIPGACADCHTSSKDRRQMSVKPFATTCAACHLPQIVGAERATGPKGIALIALPGLDVETLKEKGAKIGEWPEQSEAELVPLMRLLLGRDKERRRLLGAIDKLDLLDLTTATDVQIGDVESFVWEVKGLMYALATSKASDVMKRIGAATGVSLDQKLMAKLIATMPRDVLLGAQREWLPGLMAEMKNRGPVEWIPTIKRSAAGVTETFERQVEQPQQKIAQQQDKPERLQSDPKYGRWRVNDFGELVQEGDTSNVAPLPAEEGKETAAPAEAGSDDVSDDGRSKEAEPEPAAEPELSGFAIDAEGWAEFGGWYRKDFAVLYKPTGHADPFMKAWLDFSGHLYSNKKSNVSAPVFNLLTHKDAQGQCTKCHSVEGGGLGNRKVQWGPSSVADKNGRFTNFVHEPHFRLLDDRGCLTCHEMDTPKEFEKSYQTLNPARSAANFKPVEKKLCATCHKKDEARQDCQLCHSYHVTPLTTPITSTKLPRK